MKTSLLDLKKSDLQLVFNPKGPLLSNHLCEYKKFASITIAIGPEGGFTREEIGLAKSSGIKSISLGSRILRAETATLISITAILIQSGEL